MIFYRINMDTGITIVDIFLNCDLL